MFRTIAIAMVVCSSAIGGFLTDDDLARTIGTAYEANRDAFPRGTIRFRLDTGSAATVEAALGADWAPDASAEVLYVYDGPRRRYECLYPAVTVRAGTRKVDATHVTTRFVSRRITTNGKKTLVDMMQPVEGEADEYVHRPIVRAGTTAFDSEVLCPLQLGSPPGSPAGIASVLERTARGENSLRLAEVDDHALLDGRSLTRLRITFEGPSGGHSDYWVDLSRGAIPLEYRETLDAQGLIRVTRHDDVRSVPGHGWLPHRMTLIGMTGDKASFVRRLTIVSADFTKPGPSAFALSFPSPTTVLDEVASVRYGPLKAIDLERLPGASFGRAQKITITTDTPVPAELPLDRHPLWNAWTGLGALGLVLIVGSIILYLYRRRAHA